jgi:hypothetical protein
MTRAGIASVPLMPMLGVIAAFAGLFVLLRPAALRTRLGIADSEPATYALRIIGAMLFALGLFLGGFSLALTLNS